ncbi:hypothetical protein BJY01DRAFT_31221 [Aspergillus pseudoustus]|uniref:Uncharacterized protein n=1 Tax=Aspergillus pseudoustus TaxID=1810923 RepID=A0ABR4KTA7_9EURO
MTMICCGCSMSCRHHNKKQPYDWRDRLTSNTLCAGLQIWFSGSLGHADTFSAQLLQTTTVCNFISSLLLSSGSIVLLIEVAIVN